MDAFNSQGDAFSSRSIVTAEDLLKQLREGNTQKLEIGLGALKLPVRLINAKEEATIMAQAQIKAQKDTPLGVKKEIFEAQQTMKDILYQATRTETSPGIPLSFLEQLSNEELSNLFDQYVSINHTINPNIQSMTEDQMMEIVDGIKKKSLDVKSLYIWQLAEIGRLFLEKIVPKLPTAN